MRRPRRRSRRAVAPAPAPVARARRRDAESSTAFRWPAIMVLAGAAVSMAVLGGDATSTARSQAAASAASIAGAGDPTALSSTWYCAAGTIVAEGDQDQVIVLANPSPVEAQVDLTVFPVLAPTPITIDLESAEDIDGALTLEPPEAVDLGRVPVAVTVDPLSVRRFRVGDLEGVAGEYASVLVEAATGDLVVEHILTGPSGSAMSPCASASASSWYFAGGTTRSGSREILSIFNPFPGDAVVDLTFTTDGARRSPQIYNGLVVPSGTVLPVDVTGVVTLFDTVSAQLEVRTGRVVTERTVLIGGDDATPALSVGLGAPALSSIWAFPATSGTDAVDAIVVNNPSADEDAVVDVEIYLDRPDENGTVEPVGITIRPGRTEVVVLGQPAEAVTSGRVVDATARIPEGVGYWVAVRSINGVDVSAERMTFVDGDAAGVAPGVSAGIPVAASRHVVLSGDGVGDITVVNPVVDRIAGLEITVIVDGARFSLEPAEVAPLGRVSLDLGLLGIPADAIVEIDATEAVMAERRTALGDGGRTSSPTVPVASTTAPITLPIG